MKSHNKKKQSRNKNSKSKNPGVVPQKPAQEPDWKNDPVFGQLGGPFIVDDRDKVHVNQQAVVGKFKDQHQVVYVDAWKTFVQYNSETGVWERRSKDRIKRLLGEFIRELARKFKHHDIANRTNNPLLNALTDLLKAWGVDAWEPGQTTGIVQVANGALDLNCDPPVLKPNSPDYRFHNRGQYAYRADALCPRFLNELLRPALNQDDIDLLQRCVGAMFSGPNYDHHILLLKGTPGGGKSTLVTIIENILGLDSVAYLRPKHLGGRFEFSAFLGRRLLTGKDVPGDTLTEKGALFLKSLVGGDRLQAEIKYAGKADLKGEFHVIIACNNSLRIALDKDHDAWRRRLVLIEYNQPKVDKPVLNFAEVLCKEEGEGILAWIVEGAMKYRSLVQEQRQHELTKEQRRRVDDLIAESQSTRDFVENRVEKADKQDVTAQELMAGYIAHCRAKNWSAIPQAKAEKDFPDLMQERWEVMKRHDIMREGKAARGYRGVQLKAA